MNNIKKCLFYLLPALIAIFGYHFIDKTNETLALAPILIVLILLYILQMSITPLVGGHFILLTFVHFIVYSATLYLMFNVAVWIHMLEYGVIMGLIFWSSKQSNK